MEQKRKVILDDGSKGWSIGIQQYGSIHSEEGTEPLAAIELENGWIYHRLSLDDFRFCQ